jgi:hypothetical protein
MNAKIKQLDDLTVIKGIGPTRQEWLRKSFNIRTYDDLAALSPDELETQLKAEGRIASRSELEAWLNQAHRLADQANSTPSTATSLTTTPAVTEATLADTTNHWQAFASYVVEFQTRPVEDAAPAPLEYRTAVHHMEADIGKSWPGINTTDLCAWMLAQVSVPPEEEPIAAAADVVLVATPTALRMAISYVRLMQLPDVAVKILSNEAHRPFPGGIQSDVPFMLEVAFVLSGQGTADMVNHQLLYSAQFHLRDLNSGVSTHLGDSSPTPLSAGKDLYTARLPNVTLPPGLYRLRAIVTLYGKPPMIDYIEVPMLQVV